MVRLEHALSPYTGLKPADTDLSWVSAHRPGLGRAIAEEEMQRSALEDAAAQKVRQEGARVVVFGHTHHSCSQPLDDGAVYLNAGTWTWRRDFSGADLATWKRLIRDGEPFASDRQLTYVRIDYDDQDLPRARLAEIARPESYRPSALRRLSDWMLGKH